MAVLRIQLCVTIRLRLVMYGSMGGGGGGRARHATAHQVPSAHRCIIYRLPARGSRQRPLCHSLPTRPAARLFNMPLPARGLVV